MREDMAQSKRAPELHCFSLPLTIRLRTISRSCIPFSLILEQLRLRVLFTIQLCKSRGKSLEAFCLDKNLEVQ